MLYYIETDEAGGLNEPVKGGPFRSMKEALGAILKIGEQEAKLKGEELDEFLENSFIYEGKKEEGGLSYNYPEAKNLEDEGGNE